MIRSNDTANWEHVMKNVVLKHWPNASSNDEEDYDNEDDDDGEGVEDSRTEWLERVRPQVPKKAEIEVHAAMSMVQHQEE